MIPYIEIPPLFHIIHSFGVLVAIGILVGARVSRFRAAQLGLDDRMVQSAATWVVVVGFIVGHVFDVIAYRPRELLSDHWYVIFEPWAGLSSFGGFLGALIGIVWWSRKYNMPLLAYADSILFGLAPGWTFGRLGCFSAHDHPGKITDFWLAVKYPDVAPHARHDLGLDEAIFAAGLTALFVILYKWKSQRIGTYAALTCILYPPVRFLMDFLRRTDGVESDPRYFGLTPAQYGAVMLFVAGLFIAARAWRQPNRYTPPAPVEVPAEAGPSKKRRKK